MLTYRTPTRRLQNRRRLESLYRAKRTTADNMLNRHYNPALGKFLQRDPAGYAGGDNLYAFGGGDPLNNVDPSGLVIIFDGSLSVEQMYAIGDAYGVIYSTPEGRALIDKLQGDPRTITITANPESDNWGSTSSSTNVNGHTSRINLNLGILAYVPSDVPDDTIHAGASTTPPSLLSVLLEESIHAYQNLTEDWLRRAVNADPQNREWLYEIQAQEQVRPILDQLNGVYAGTPQYQWTETWPTYLPAGWLHDTQRALDRYQVILQKLQQQYQ